MKWLKALFQNSDKELQEGDYVLLSPAELAKEEKGGGIGEPVYSFVKCVQENPKRFSLVRESLKYGISRFKFTDKQTKQSWLVKFYPYTEHSDVMMGDGIKWMTDDEKLYVQKAVAIVYNERLKRYMIAKNERRSRVLENERKRLMGVYCK